MKIVIDTSVYIDYLRSKKGLYIDLMELGHKHTFYTPTIVIQELWSGKSMGDPEVEKIVDRMIKPTKVIGLSKQVAKKSGDLIRKNLVSDPEDAIIAATSLLLEAFLATHNTKHFKKVKGLRLFTLEG